MDDGLLYGTPEAVKWCLDLIEKLEPISGLKLKWVKMSVHAPNAMSAQLCRILIPSVKVIEDKEMNFVYLPKMSNWFRQICGELFGGEIE